MLGAVAAQCGLGRCDGPLDALGLAAPGADRASELPQPLGDRSHPGVGLVQALECGLHRVVGRRHPLGGGRQSELGLLAAADRVLDLVLASRRRPPGSRSGWAPDALPPRTKPGAKTSPSGVTAVMP